MVVGMGLLLDRSVVTFRSLQLQMPVIHPFVLFYFYFMGGQNSTSNGKKLNGELAKNSCQYAGGFEQMCTEIPFTSIYLALACSKLLHLHQRFNSLFCYFSWCRHLHAASVLKAFLVNG